MDPNQKKKGLSFGFAPKNSSKFLKFFPAGLSWYPPILKFPGPQPFCSLPTNPPDA